MHLNRKDTSERMLLNFGHAIEAYYNSEYKTKIAEFYTNLMTNSRSIQEKILDEK